MTETNHQINREYKDRLFKLVFREKKDLLELYNAVNHTDYNNPEELEINSIEDAIYMGMKNDISFLIKDTMNLYEHQSTFSPNLPLRGLWYFADLYRKLIGTDRDIYSSRQIFLPYPCFLVFYNGTKQEPERQILELSHAFSPQYQKEKSALQCRAVVLNINWGCNRALMDKCRKLKEYALFINRVRKHMAKGEAVTFAVDCAVNECIRENILADILKNHREEVYSMLLYEYNEQAHIENEREIAREEGELLKLITLIKKKLTRGKTLNEIANDLEETPGDISFIYDIALVQPERTAEEILELIIRKSMQFNTSQ